MWQLNGAFERDILRMRLRKPRQVNRVAVALAIRHYSSSFCGQSCVYSVVAFFSRHGHLYLCCVNCQNAEIVDCGRCSPVVLYRIHACFFCPYSVYRLFGVSPSALGACAARAFSPNASSLSAYSNARSLIMQKLPLSFGVKRAEMPVLKNRYF